MSYSQTFSKKEIGAPASSLRRRQVRNHRRGASDRKSACLTYRQFNAAQCEFGQWLILFKTFDGVRTFQRKYIPCDSWQCPVCSAKKKRKMYKLIKKACPKADFFLLTVTLRKNESNLLENWQRLAKCWNTLLSRLRKKVDRLKYFRVVELQQNGMPHIHSLINLYLEEEEIKQIWLEITGDSFIAKFEKVKFSCAGYILKYFQKTLVDIKYIREATGKKTKLFVYSRFLLLRKKHLSDWELWSMHKSITEAIEELKYITAISFTRFARAGPVELICDPDHKLLSISFKSYCEF